MSHTQEKLWAIVKDGPQPGVIGIIYNTLAPTEKETWLKGVEQMYGPGDPIKSLTLYKKILERSGYRARRVVVSLKEKDT